MYEYPHKGCDILYKSIPNAGSAQLNFVLEHGYAITHHLMSRTTLFIQAQILINCCFKKMTTDDHITVICKSVTLAFVVPPINNVDHTQPPVTRLLKKQEYTTSPRMAAETITSDRCEI